MTSRATVRCGGGLVVFALTMLGVAGGCTAPRDARGAALPTTAAEPGTALGALAIWDDGLAEMAYYDAEYTIYGERRAYTRVQLLNREWFDPDSGVKVSPDTPGAVEVFKLNIAEEVPTENYNYRFLTTVFAERDTLALRKLATSSQEWCGLTYKHARWRDDGLDVQSFSYFAGEAEETASLPASVMPFEASFLLVRQYVATAAIPDEPVALLPPLRSNHGIGSLAAAPGKFTLGAAEELTTPAGTGAARPVTLEHAGKTYRYWVQQAPPYLLLRYEGPGEGVELAALERRAYWDQEWESDVHPVNEAP
jgi:hypothetical protein